MVRKNETIPLETLVILLCFDIMWQKCILCVDFGILSWQRLPGNHHRISTTRKALNNLIKNSPTVRRMPGELFKNMQDILEVSRVD